MEKSKSFLIDTQIFLWWMEKSKRLSKNLYQLLNDSQNRIFLSVGTIWEIIIKRAKKKLKLSLDIEEGIKSSGFSVLPIEITHVLGIEDLPAIHQDPFDRILVAQAKAEELVIITSDPKIKKYPIRVYKK